MYKINFKGSYFFYRANSFFFTSCVFNVLCFSFLNFVAIPFSYSDVILDFNCNLFCIYMFFLSMCGVILAGLMSRMGYLFLKMVQVSVMLVVKKKLLFFFLKKKTI